MKIQEIFCRKCPYKKNSDLLEHAGLAAKAKDDRKAFVGIHTDGNTTYECYITLKEKKHGKQTKRD